MDSEFGRAGLAFSLAIRTIAAGGLAFAVLQVLVNTHYYATAAALAGLFLLTTWNTAKVQNRPQPEKLESSEERGRRQAQLDRATALLDAVTVAFIALSDDGRISFVNRAARQLGGEAGGEISGIAALGADVTAQILGMPVGARRIVSLADGRQVLVWTVGFIVSGQAPERLISLQAVAGELDAVQLKAWQDMTRVLSHEIMNSLTPIASLAESAADLMRKKEAAEPKVARAVESIAQRSLHLIDFVERYREIGDLPEPRRLSIRVDDLATDLEGVLHADLAERGIDYRREISPADLKIDADAEQLSQAILNLLRNAIEAVAGEERPVIRLSCAEAGDEIVLAVADNGPGIPDDRIQEVFVPFFTTKAEGYGIGLTLARQIALAHGGRIEASNDREGGAVLRMSLPARSGCATGGAANARAG